MLHCLKEKITGSKIGMVVAVLVVLAVLPFIFSWVTEPWEVFWAGGRTGSDTCGAGTDDGAGICWRNYAVRSGCSESV